jgi:hypothetical protein
MFKSDSAAQSLTLLLQHLNYAPAFLLLFQGLMSLRRASSMLGAAARTKVQETHSSIDNPYGFPLPEAGTVILEEEVVKEGHLIKNLKRRLFTLLIDSENFPCLIYAYVSSCARTIIVFFRPSNFFVSSAIQNQRATLTRGMIIPKRRDTFGWYVAV